MSPPPAHSNGGESLGRASGPPHRSRLVALLATLLFGATLLLFWPATGYEFLTIDDGSYVYANPHVRAGLSGDGVVWAFTRSYSSNWHPLTWLSHMLDSELYRMRPYGHHATSIALHAAAASLLFVAFCRLRMGLWAAAFTAAFFAWHPLRGESVAWVAERKDVLSGLFLALILLAWARYARRPSVPRYTLVALAFALGLLAKPMLVTLPLLLVLLDVWPLGRVRWRASEHDPSATTTRGQTRSLPGLLLEKLPLLGLSIASCAVTVLVQAKGGAVRSLLQVSLEDRLSNAIASVWVYVGKSLWPEPLAAFYPHPALVFPESFEPWRAGLLGAAALLLFASAAAWLLRRRAPFLLVGWGWFLLSLMPVIGIVQVGEQAYADRYTYLPGIGLGLLFSASAAALARARPGWTRPITAVALIGLGMLALRTRTTLEPWRDTESLFRHALSVTERNYVAHFNLGVALEARGAVEEARDEYEATLAIKPDSSDARFNLGSLLLASGDFPAAEQHLQRAVAQRPQRVQGHVNLGIALAEQGRLDEGEAALQQALEIQPGSAEAWSNLGGLSAKRGSLREARTRFERALELSPDLLGARYQLGLVLYRLGQREAAGDAFERVLARDPDHPGAREWSRRVRQAAIEREPQGPGAAGADDEAASGPRGGDSNG